VQEEEEGAKNKKKRVITQIRCGEKKKKVSGAPDGEEKTDEEKTGVKRRMDVMQRRERRWVKSDSVDFALNL